MYIPRDESSPKHRSPLLCHRVGESWHEGIKTPTTTERKKRLESLSAADALVLEVRLSMAHVILDTLTGITVELV